MAGLLATYLRPAIVMPRSMLLKLSVTALNIGLSTNVLIRDLRGKSGTEITAVSDFTRHSLQDRRRGAEGSIAATAHNGQRTLLRADNTYRNISIGDAVPAVFTICDKVIPPDTGASSMSAPIALMASATSLLTLCSMVDWSRHKVAARSS